MTGRSALFIDGENIGSQFAEEILDVAQGRGPVDVRRVYGNVTKISDWASRPGFRVIHSETNKNAADILLTIDVMEFVLTKGVTSVVIASSDGGFAHLAIRLRERGVEVTGVGEAKAPTEFREACLHFHQIGRPQATAQPDVAPASDGPPSDLDRKIRAIIAEHSKNGGGILLKQLNPVMSRRYQTQISTFPEKTWRGYFVKRPHLFEIDPKGPEAKVRFLPAGFAD